MVLNLIRYISVVRCEMLTVYSCVTVNSTETKYLTAVNVSYEEGYHFVDYSNDLSKQYICSFSGDWSPQFILCAGNVCSHTPVILLNKTYWKSSFSKYCNNWPGGVFKSIVAPIVSRNAA